MPAGTAMPARRTCRPPRRTRERFCLTDAEVLDLADYAIRIEDHYSQLAGHPSPMDIEWAKDGEDGKLYIVQARPETVASQRRHGRFRDLCAQGRLVRCWSPAARSARRSPPARCGVVAGCARPRRLPPGRGAGRRGDEPRLGAGDEDRGGDRHQPRRAHLPRRDCRPRARRACGGRRRRGAREAADRGGRHRQLRRGRSRQGL